MNNIVIRAEKIDKLFHIGAKQASYKTLRDTVTDAFTAPFRRMGKLLRGQASGASELDEEIWALKDISFEIKKGEVVGFIGSNGAGKSTLLKVMSRITEPTNGYAEIRGRVGSLLEVGTGFHPELTGRENIYLNGAILGMKRIEINKKFDEIVAFSEVEKFIDTPVKHYSSGMYLRLAFAVAAHLEPEILVVDEVLAVGDARFQKKCLSKMEDVAQQGRTILFVSHNMGAVSRLCKRAILLNQGSILKEGASKDVIGTYLNSGLAMTSTREWNERRSAPGNHVARLRKVQVTNEEGQVTGTVDICSPVGIEMEYEVLEPGCVLLPNLNFEDEEGVLVFVAIDQDKEWMNLPRPAGTYKSTAWIPGNLLADGTFTVEACLHSMNPRASIFTVPRSVAFQVVDNFGVESSRGIWPDRIPGNVRPRLRWTTRFSSSNAAVIT